MLVAIALAVLALTAKLACAGPLRRPADRAADPVAAPSAAPVSAVRADARSSDAPDTESGIDLREHELGEPDLGEPELGEPELGDLDLDALDLGDNLDHDDLNDALDDADVRDLGDVVDSDDLPEELDGLQRDDAASHASSDAVNTGVRVAAAGADEAREAALRGRRSPIGRFDLSMFWRHTDPMISPVRDELWLMGTWRR